MLVTEAMGLAIEILRTVAESCTATGNKEAMESAKDLVNAADALEKVHRAGMALAVSPKEMAERLRNVGFPENVASGAARVANELGLAGVVARAQDFEKRMVAAGLDPKAMRDKIQAAADAGKPDEAHAVFQSIRDEIARFEKGKPS